MELELGLALPNPHQPAGGGGKFISLLDGDCGKRVFGDAFGGADEKATLPLFIRDGDGGGGGGDRDGVDDSEPSNKRKRLVGWPPVKCAHLRRSCGGGSGYVKVKMEGVAIGRKVDVSLHASYEELLRTLARMFPPANNNGAEEEEEEEVAVAQQAERGGHGGHHPYYAAVTYEDGDGDWRLLVGDVPWEAFAKSVKRLKILA